MESHTVYLALGTNLGNLAANMLAAINEIGIHVGTVVRISSFIESEPQGFESEHQFLNAVCKVETQLTPHELLLATQTIERKLGRTHKSVNGVYSDRTMDIDILLYDDISIQTSELTIPHPRMWERPFVFEPLLEIGYQQKKSDVH